MRFAPVFGFRFDRNSARARARPRQPPRGRSAREPRAAFRRGDGGVAEGRTHTCARAHLSAETPRLRSAAGRRRRASAGGGFACACAAPQRVRRAPACHHGEGCQLPQPYVAREEEASGSGRGRRRARGCAAAAAARRRRPLASPFFFFPFSSFFFMAFRAAAARARGGWGARGRRAPPRARGVGPAAPRG